MHRIELITTEIGCSSVVRSAPRPPWHRSQRVQSSQRAGSTSRGWHAWPANQQSMEENHGKTMYSPRKFKGVHGKLIKFCWWEFSKAIFFGCWRVCMGFEQQILWSSGLVVVWKWSAPDKKMGQWNSWGIMEYNIGCIYIWYIMNIGDTMEYGI